MSSDPLKTVFISYRRSTSAFMARAVFMALRDSGWDTFMDVENITGGEFETIILRQIEARAHFLVILSPGAVERCAEPGDWLRREIEHAIDQRRNVVPLLIGDFRFEDNQRYLTGKLARLSAYDALNVPHDYFDEAMVRLREKYLSKTLQGTLAPVPAADARAVQRKVQQAAQAGVPTNAEMSAEDWYTRAYALYEDGDHAGALAGFSRALELNPGYSEAFNMRGYMYRLQDNLPRAMADYDASIKADPNNEVAYINRGKARRMQDDIEGAIADYSKALRINPAAVTAWNNRGYAHNLRENYKAGESDLSEAIKLDPDYASAYWARGYARYWQKNWAGALADFERYAAMGTMAQDNMTDQVEEYIRECKRNLGR